MLVPLDICFQAMERDEQVVWEVDAQIAELEGLSDSIIGCDVVIHGPGARDYETYDHTNGLYDVRIVLALPCREIVVERDQNADANVFAAIDKAFLAARQQFEAWLANRQQLHAESR